MIAVVALIGALGVAPFASAQGDPALLNALLAEVRLLRQALERQGAVSGRAQLLVGRLALQDQRVMRWQSEVARLESDVAGLAERRSLNQARLTEMRNSIRDDRDADRVQALEQETRLLETQVKQEAAQQAALEQRRAEAAQALEGERARYEELSERLERLERELDKPSR